MGKRNQNFQRFVQHRSRSLAGNSQAQLSKNQNQVHRAAEERWDSWFFACGRLCRRFIIPDYGPSAGKTVEIFRNGRQRVVEE